MPRRAERPFRSGVGVDALVLAPHVGAPVQLPDDEVRGARATFGVGPTGAKHPRLEGDERTVAGGAGLQHDRVGRPVAHGEAHLFAREEQADRAPGLLREQRRDDGVLAGREPGAKAAANVVADDADVGERDAERAGQVGLHGVDALRGLPDGEAGAVPLRHAAVQFERVLQLAGCLELVLDDHLGRGEARRDVAALVGLRRCDRVAPVAHRRRAGLQGAGRVHDVVEHLVLDRDCAHRVPGLVDRVGRDRRHLFPLVAAVRVEQPAREGTRPVAEPRDGCAGRPVLDDGLNARQTLGLARVHALDHRVRVGAPEDGRMQHVREDHVRGVDRRAAHPVVGIDADEWPAHYPGLSPGLGRRRGLRRLGRRALPVVPLIGVHGWPPGRASVSAAFSTALKIWA